MQIQSLPFYQLNYPGSTATVILHRRQGGLQLSRSLDVAAAVGWCLTVAIWAKHPQVFQTVIVPYSINMVDVDA